MYQRMRLTEIYNDLTLREFWKQVEVDYMSGESAGLPELIKEAQVSVFNKFKIKPSNKVYFIAGSATLYLYPKVRELFNLKGSIGDLDIIIPNEELWVNAGLEKELNEGGVYRPNGSSEIEVFTEWAPNRAGGEYSDTSVRSTDEILKDAINVNGYYFMSLYDVIDYKSKMNREKEVEITNMVTDYVNKPTTDKAVLLRKIVNLIGFNETKTLLGRGK